MGDMRAIPFEEGSFASVLSVQSIEHVPDHRRVLEEVTRVLEPEGSAIFVTPNRLTFARPDEIIDPYHYVEYDHSELRTACEPYFELVEMYGLFGSDRYLELVAGERRKLDALLRKDPLRLRRLVPRGVRQRLYDRRLTSERENPHPGARGDHRRRLRAQGRGLGAGARRRRRLPLAASSATQARATRLIAAPSQKPVRSSRKSTTLVPLDTGTPMAAKFVGRSSVARPSTSAFQSRE